MIVRINQFDPSRAESSAGWPANGLAGPLKYKWPNESHAFEVLILDHDEQQESLTEAFRQKQLRQLIPDVIAALRETGEEIVVRLDGPLAEGELAGGFEHIVEPDGAGRYAFSSAERPRGRLACPDCQPSPSPHRSAAEHADERPEHRL